MGRKRTQMDVTLKFLLDNGDILPGAGVLQVSTRDQTRYADLGSDGIIHFEGNRHRSLSSFAVAAIRSCGATSRKTANGWQVVSYLGRPLEQLRAEFLERQSHGSESSRDADQVAGNGSRVPRKQRRTMLGKSHEGVGAEALPKSLDWRAGPSSGEMLMENLHGSDSGVSLASSTEAATTVYKRPPWTKTFMQKRARPSRTWFDTLRPEIPIHRGAILGREMNSSGVKLTNYVRCVDGACGLKLDKDITVKGSTSTEEEEDADQTLVVNMWLKKALSKRHREECGMTS